jgi:NitT/TauT family transport system substrate-binding protein
MGATLVAASTLHARKSDVREGLSVTPRQRGAVRAILNGAIFGALLGPIAVHAADKWRYGVVEAKGDAGLIFMPSRFGNKYDLDIEMVEFASSTTPVKALISGDIDAFTASPGVALTAMSRGGALKFVGCNWPGATYTLYGAPDIKTIADLKGKSVGVSGPGSMPDLFAREALMEKGISLDQVTFANAGGGSDRFRALLAGVVKATATSSEFEPEAAKHGINILAQAHLVTPMFSRNCIVTTAKTIVEKRDQLVRFLAANMDGYDYALTHRDETNALARKIAKLSDDDLSAVFIYDEAVSQKNVDPQLAIPADRLQWIENALARHGAIDTEKDVKAFMDDSPRLAALKIRKP